MHDERAYLARVVLPIGVYLDDDLEATGLCEPEAGPQGTANPEVERQSQDLRPGACGRIGGPVGRAVVDHDNRISLAPHICDHAAD